MENHVTLYQNLATKYSLSICICRNAKIRIFYAGHDEACMVQLQTSGGYSSHLQEHEASKGANESCSNAVDRLARSYVLKGAVLGRLLRRDVNNPRRVRDSSNTTTN